MGILLASTTTRFPAVAERRQIQPVVGGTYVIGSGISELQMWLLNPLSLITDPESLVLESAILESVTLNRIIESRNLCLGWTYWIRGSEDSKDEGCNRIRDSTMSDPGSAISDEEFSVPGGRP
jgi:hypothetical protein